MATSSKSRYTLAGPCSNCPFRNDQPSYLKPERVIEIAETLLAQEEFYCHKTVDYPDNPETGGADPVVGGRARVCGGATATMAREGRSTQMERITERLGLPVAEADSEAPVYDSIAEWVRAKNGVPAVTQMVMGKPETMELEHCGVVGSECEDPAGYAGWGGATANLEEPMCNPFEGCEACGSAMCPACRADDHYCINCAEEDSDDEDSLNVIW